MNAQPITSMRANAWPSHEATAVDRDAAARWALRRDIVAAPAVEELLAPRPLPDFTDWTDSRVGWGIVLPPAPKGLSSRESARACDAPKPIRELVSKRNAVVLRLDAERPWMVLNNPATNHSLDIGGSPHGMGPDSIPYYLMLYGTPDQIPWRLQYLLSATRAVGRLHLSGVQLENYVRALLTDWRDGQGARNDVAVWAVDQHDGITTLMKESVADRVAARMRDDIEIRFASDDLEIPAAEFAATLRQQNPSFILTTSHGYAAALDDRDALAKKIGTPVDATGTTLFEVLDQWQPRGAIWYMHACCSAGTDSMSRFDGLFETGTKLDRLVRSVASVGSTVSPIATKLLGADEPLRALVGHVEPTFDYTLRQPFDGQATTNALVDGLYDRLFQTRRRTPIAWALAPWFRRRQTLWEQFTIAREQFDQGVDKVAELLFYQLVARDIQSTVILGDPAAALPA